jgi:putative Holliday junction resolvase
LTTSGNGSIPGPKILTGVLLAVDYGLKRVGLAICDAEGRVAVGAGRVEGLTSSALALAIMAAARVRGATGIVLGEPLPTRGNEELIEGVGELRQQLEREGYPVTFWPEGYSTAQAHAARKHFGGKRSGGKSWADEAAAVILLQDYLEWRRGRGEV